MLLPMAFIGTLHNSVCINLMTRGFALDVFFLEPKTVYLKALLYMPTKKPKSCYLHFWKMQEKF